MSSFIDHKPCPDCGSSDAVARYDDGHGYCFACPAESAYKHSGDESREATPQEQSAHSADLWKYTIPIGGLPARKLLQATLEKWQYGVSHGWSHHVANYLEGGTLVGQKMRDANKKMLVAGKLPPLYGQWLWKEGGKRIVVTEGEIDALSVSQSNGLKYPVVSVSKGAAGAAGCVRQSLPFLESYDEVVFMFDMDEPGQKAAKECAELLAPGKAFIAHLPLNDPNDLLKAGREKDIRTAFFEAPPYRPDGILTPAEVWEHLDAYRTQPIGRFPFTGLDTKTLGYREGEIILCVGGISSGKSTLMKEIAHSADEQGLKVGIMSLEEPVAQYVLGLAGIRMGENLKLVDGIPQDREDFKSAASHYIDSGQMVFYHDHGQRKVKAVFNRIQYMAVGLGVQVVILDHLTVMIGGASEADDRRYADQIMSELEALVKRTGVTVVVVMHLKKAGEGLSHEQGRTVSMSDIRGSGMIPALSHTIFAFERDQQAEDPSVGQVRLLRCRWTGLAGEAGKLKYHRDTGRLLDWSEDVEALGPLEPVVVPSLPQGHAEFEAALKAGRPAF